MALSEERNFDFLMTSFRLLDLTKAGGFSLEGIRFSSIWRSCRASGAPLALGALGRGRRDA